MYKVTERDEERDRQITETNQEVKTNSQRLHTIEEMLKKNGYQHLETTAEPGEDVQSLLQETQNALEKEKARCDIAEASHEETRRELEQVKRDVEESGKLYEEHLQKMQEQWNQLNEVNKANKNEIAYFKTEKEELTQEVKSLQREKENMFREGTTMKEDIRKLQRELNEQGSRAEIEKRKYDSQSAEQLEKHKESRSQADLKLSAETRRADKAERDKGDLAEKLRATQDQLRTRDIQHQEAKEAVTIQHQEAMEGVVHQLRQKQEQLEQLDMERQVGERQRNELQKQQRDLQASKAHFERERSEMESRDRETQLRIQEFDKREHELQTRDRQLQVSLQEAERARLEHNRWREEQDAIETQRSQELERRAAELQEQKPRLALAEKENKRLQAEIKRLQAAVQEQKALLWKCERMHKTEIASQQILSAGEAARIFKCREDSVARSKNQLAIELLDKDETIASLEGCVGNILRFLEARHIRIEDLKESRLLCDNIEDIDNVMSSRLGR